MRVLLVNANSSSDVTTSVPLARLPYGILYIASVLEANGDEVLIVDRNTEPDRIENVLSTFAPQLVGVSVMTGPCILDALHVSRLSKKMNPNIYVVWGGVHPTLLPELCLLEPSIDFVVRREGEYTLRELVNVLKRGGDITKVNGISFRRDGEIHHAAGCAFIKELDELPFPAWHLVNMNKYMTQGPDGRKYISMNTSRGCPYRCAFCYNQLFNERHWRGLSAERVLAQVHDLVHQFDAGYIEFLEDNFTVNHRRLEQICDSLIEERLDIQWYCEARVGSLDEDMLTKMKRAGCVGIGFGVESGSPRILELMCKDITIEQTIQTFDLCRKIGIYPDAYAMTGIPSETVDDFNMTMKLLARIRYRFCDFMVYRPYPGSELYEMCLKEGLFTPPANLEGWAEISDLHSAKFSVGQIPESMIKAAKRKTLLRNRYNSAMIAIRTVPFYKLIGRLPHWIRATIRAVKM